MYKIRTVNFKSQQEIEEVLRHMEVDHLGIKIMAPKAQLQCIKLQDVPISTAHILKQEMLSIGGDAAVSKWVITGKVTETPVILIGTYRHYQKLIKKLEIQPFRLKQLAKHIEQVLKMNNKVLSPLEFRNMVIPVEGKVVMIGTIDVTEDNFYERCLGLENDGVDILCIECNNCDNLKKQGKAIKVIMDLSKKTDLPLAIETDSYRMLNEAAELGIELIFTGRKIQNNDQELLQEIISSNLYLALTCDSLFADINDSSLVGGLVECFKEQINFADSLGIDVDRLIIEPGIKIGIVNKLDELKMLGKPIIINMDSQNNSFIGKKEGSAALASLAIVRGVNIIKSKEIKEIIKIRDIFDEITAR